MFTQRHPLLLLPRSHSLRPQLPYLHQPSIVGTHSTPTLHRHLARLVSTENRIYVKEQTWLALKWSALGWTAFGLLSIAWYGWQSELVERKHPTPPEWSFSARSTFRSAHMDQATTGNINWATVGSDFRNVLTFLETPSVDGNGIRQINTGSADWNDLFALGHDTAYDVSDKSQPWRTGYFDTVMACGRAAEMLNDSVVDKTRNHVFPKDVVIGPSNPVPRPTPPFMSAAPLEENCAPAYESPQTFYLRILHGQGFLTGQRVDAALALAHWLELRGETDHADAVYTRILDISRTTATSVQRTASATAVVSDNILRAQMALGTFYARNKKPQDALPAFLTALQSFRSAPLQSHLPSSQPQDSTSTGRSLFKWSKYPDPRPTGDEPYTRPIRSTDCQEEEVMLYIGEIVFATSIANRKDGLAWTKKAVEMAQRKLHSARDASAADANTSKSCKDCLALGVSNWSKMVGILARQEDERKVAEAQSWTRWLGLGDTTRDLPNPWEAERLQVEKLNDSIIRNSISEQMNSSSGGSGLPGKIWLGG